MFFRPPASVRQKCKAEIGPGSFYACRTLACDWLGIHEGLLAVAKGTCLLTGAVSGSIACPVCMCIQRWLPPRVVRCAPANRLDQDSSAREYKMPTYEYKCASCGHEWEVEQRIVEDPLTECPVCLKDTAKRQICSANFILKGGGWYADLYASPSNRPPNASNSAQHTSGSASGHSSTGGSSSANAASTNGSSAVQTGASAAASSSDSVGSPGAATLSASSAAGGSSASSVSTTASKST